MARSGRRRGDRWLAMAASSDLRRTGVSIVTVGLLVAAFLITLTVQDALGRRAAVREQVDRIAHDTANDIALAVAKERADAEVIAHTLLADDVDNTVLTDALPLTGVPIAGVIDVEQGEMLAMVLDVGEPVDLSDVTLDDALAALPNLARALKGTPTLDFVTSGEAEGLLVHSIPYTANDGTARVLATGALTQTANLSATFTDAPTGLRVHLDPVTPGADHGSDHADAELLAAAPIDGTAWEVLLETTYAEMDARLRWHTPFVAVQIAGILGGIGLIMWLWWRQVHATRDIARSNERLAWVARQQQEVAAVLAHELRTPITRTFGMSSLLTDRWDDLAEEQRRFLASRVAAAGGDLARLIEQLQCLVDAGAQALRPDLETVPVGWVLQEALRQARVDSDDVEVHLLNPADVLVEPTLATRALAALVDNGLTHGEPPVEIVGAVDGDDLAISVTDHGPGVPARFAPTMFDPFTQASDHLTRDNGGLGVGLYLVKAFAELCGGTISHEPTETGARFVLRLPLANGDGRPREPRDVATATATASGRADRAATPADAPDPTPVSVSGSTTLTG